MEIKWLMIAWAIIMVALSADSAFNSYQEKQCTIEVAKTGNVNSETIKKICGN